MLVLNLKEIYKFGRIQTSQTGGGLFSDTSPFEVSEFSLLSPTVSVLRPARSILTFSLEIFSRSFSVMSGVQKVVHRQDGVVRVAKDQNRSSVEILQFRFNSCGIEHFSRWR